MSAPQDQALSAIAFQLAATLDGYEEGISALLAAPLDAERYRRVSEQVDQMRMYSAALPILSGAWVEVLIRHFELTHGIFRAQRGTGNVALPDLHEQLLGSVRRLSRRCVQLMPAA